MAAPGRRIVARPPAAACVVTNLRGGGPAGNRRYRSRSSTTQFSGRIMMTHSSNEQEARKADTRAERAKANERGGADREVEQELQTVQPGSDAPSRAGVTPEGSGADGERG